MNQLELSGVELGCVRNEQTVFSCLNFILSEGQILQILGPNGAGKSTLLKILAGLRQPDEGSILCNGLPIAEQLESYHHQLAYLGHRLALKPHLTVWESLELDPRNRHDKANVVEVLTGLGLVDKIKQETQDLSQGQQQRLAIAAIILSQRKLWLLDEPFAAVDHETFMYLQNVFWQHLQNNGMIVLTSHRELTLLELNAQTLEMVCVC